MIATIYNTQTGKISSVIESPDMATILLNVQPGEGIIEGKYDPNTTYITFEGEPLPLPPKPNRWAEWNGSQWIDNRTQADFDAELEDRRAAAFLSRCDAVLAAVNAGIILPEEAGEAARGQVPPSLASTLSSLPPQMRLEAEVRWSGGTIIERTNPILITLAQARGITEAQLDEMFGISVPTE